MASPLSPILVLARFIPGFGARVRTLPDGGIVALPARGGSCASGRSWRSVADFPGIVTCPFPDLNARPVFRHGTFSDV